MDKHNLVLALTKDIVTFNSLVVLKLTVTSEESLGGNGDSSLLCNLFFNFNYSGPPVHSESEAILGYGVINLWKGMRRGKGRISE